jgi:hypothetical protein
MKKVLTLRTSRKRGKQYKKGERGGVPARLVSRMSSKSNSLLPPEGDTIFVRLRVYILDQMTFTLEAQQLNLEKN